MLSLNRFQIYKAQGSAEIFIVLLSKEKIARETSKNGVFLKIKDFCIFLV